MKRKILSGKDLIKLGYPEGRAVGIAINTVLKHFRRSEKEEIFELLKNVRANPKLFVNDSIWSKVALELVPTEKKSLVHELHKKRLDYRIFGASEIEEGARNQMEIAMKLPITVAGALMPDAHQGYGLPIGGVLATRNAVIPYGVGVDIGCRMCLTAYAIDEKFLERHRSNLKQLLIDNTCFGRETFQRPKEHEVLDRKLFQEITVLKPLKGKAAQQIGSSGSGNHFVEFGLMELKDSNEWQLPSGKYLALLSHSGSRGLGAEIARHYTRVAKQICLLPGEAASLAWLDLDTEAGQEYWQAMNLAGDYASACHHQIHERMAQALGERPLLQVENHHNFAWREKLGDGTDVIVHRKGATPADTGVLGIIPGSMTAPGFVVRGKGEASSLNSASHGAGRLMSRGVAKQSITNKMVKQELERHHVTLLGGGLDEAPMAYKDIRQVMRYQHELVDVIGEFTPKIVRMCGDDTSPED
ncbi:MAG: RtcB family protein [Bacteroidota bacterium]|jgi:tRNA-splicing ligase RtcB|nr:RtcB family protein [Cytophagales bacterium]MCE2956769.1 RtcB family protein [Flammeovirgaceae bacterium]MCZ8069174.1 RtcB family protein [Cytophagales bacterium]